MLVVRAGLFTHTVLFHPVAVVVDNECDNEYYEDSRHNRPSVPALVPALMSRGHFLRYVRAGKRRPLLKTRVSRKKQIH